MLSDRPSPEKRGGEGWHNFRREREAFLEWLAAQRSDGVFFLSGDIYFTHLTESERPGTCPLTELTCSPLTSRVHPRPFPVHEVPGTLVTQRNFCTLEFSGPAGARLLRVAAWNASGTRLWQEDRVAGSGAPGHEGHAAPGATAFPPPTRILTGTGLDTRFAAPVMRDEDKAAARGRIATPLLFSIHEAKGLEFGNVVLYRIVSDTRSELADIAAGVDHADLAAATLEYRRARAARTTRRWMLSTSPS